MGEFQNEAPLTPKQEDASVFVAHDELTDEKIAETLKIGRRTLATWKQLPAFKIRVTEHLSAYRVEIRNKGIAVVENRVNEANKRHALMQQVIAERAADPKMQDVPGGKTGLLVHQIKGVGKGDDFELMDIFAVDNGLLAEMRAHEMQVAKDLGQLVDRSQVDVHDHTTAESLERKLAGIAAGRSASPVSPEPDPAGA